MKLNKKKLENYFKKNSKKFLVIDSDGKKTTYSDFYKKSLYVIFYLKKLGIKKNTKIIILSDNSLNYLITLNACLLGGYTACPLDPSIKKERLIAIKKIYKKSFIIKDVSKIRFKKLFLKEGLIDYQNTQCLILYGSNEKGEPKGIVLSSDSIIKSSISFSKLANYDSDSRILHCLPMFYMGGILDTFFACICSGSTILLDKRFSIMNILNFWKLPLKMKCNVLFLTPFIVAFLTLIFRKPSLKIKKHVSKYKSIIATGDYLYPETRKKFYDIFNKKIFSCYGATELGGPVAIQKKNHTSENFCVGSHAQEIKIIAKNTINKQKTIYIKSPYLMDGYLTKNGIEKIKEIKGYFDTGDTGKYSKGLLFISGRKRNIIKKGGELIYLDLIEKITLNILNVDEAAAIGKKDEIAGEEIYLFVRILKKNLSNKKLNDIRKILTMKLRPIEVPKKIISIQKIPKNKNGEKDIKKLLEMI